jgi:hypothetical protein
MLHQFRRGEAVHAYDRQAERKRLQDDETVSIVVSGENKNVAVRIKFNYFPIGNPLRQSDLAVPAEPRMDPLRDIAYRGKTAVVFVGQLFESKQTLIAAFLVEIVAYEKEIERAACALDALSWRHHGVEGFHFLRDFCVL